ncbi:hypothetical protein [uncultured Methanoculleus sp.]|uniref:Uncharacterized protein n=1 Tax=Methanoculleus palmolei TaxID=72612 RepID=A0ABD8AAQ6_9EURY|nr:hypothetical protein R6Y95_04675 [Methanoculleus palmolei]
MRNGQRRCSRSRGFSATRTFERAKVDLRRCDVYGRVYHSQEAHENICEV